MGAPLTPTDPFAEVALLAAYLQVTIADTDAMALTALEGATSLIQAYCDQMIAFFEDDIVTVDGTGTDILLLPEHPVVAVTEIETGVDDGAPVSLIAPDETVGGDYTWSMTGLVAKKNGTWGLGHQSIRVTYSHGYEQIPAEVQIVCVAAASRAYAQDGATQESAGSYNASYAGQPGTLTADEKRVLDRYRSRRK